MKLTELEPRFVRYETKTEDYEVIVGDEATWRDRGMPVETKTGPRQYIIHKGVTLENAQGMWFLCPKCLAENIAQVDQSSIGPNDRADDLQSAGVGIHQCEITFEGRGATPEQGSHGSSGEPSRWNVSGTSFEDLTTTPSIQIGGGCNWHGFFTSGEIVHA